MVLAYQSVDELRKCSKGDNHLFQPWPFFNGAVNRRSSE